MIVPAQLAIYLSSFLMIAVHIGNCLPEKVSSDAMISSTVEAALKKSNSLDSVLSEMKSIYPHFIDSNPNAEYYSLYQIIDNNDTIKYDGSQFLVINSPIMLGDITEHIVKRHDNCLNRNKSYKCQGCSGKFLGYSSAHNCKGKYVSCCVPQGPTGTSYGCVCYKRNQAVKKDLGSAGCCS